MQVELRVALLVEAIQRVEEKGHSPDLANNSALLHEAVFGFVKEQKAEVGRNIALRRSIRRRTALARQFLSRLREQLP